MGAWREGAHKTHDPNHLAAAADDTFADEVTAASAISEPPLPDGEGGSSASASPPARETIEQITARVLPTLPPLAHGSEPGSMSSLAA